jgi:hypothetical protein
VVCADSYKKESVQKVEMLQASSASSGLAVLPAATFALSPECVAIVFILFRYFRVAVLADKNRTPYTEACSGFRL